MMRSGMIHINHSHVKELGIHNGFMFDIYSQWETYDSVILKNHTRHSIVVAFQLNLNAIFKPSFSFYESLAKVYSKKACS